MINAILPREDTGNSSGNGDADLLARYIATFEILDDLYAFEVSPALRTQPRRSDRSGNRYGMKRWSPKRGATPGSALEELYQELGLSDLKSRVKRFPPLYETLIFSYRWQRVDLGDYRLLASEPGKGLSPLLSAIRADKYLSEVLMSNGFIPFGMGPDADYDPVCFDMRQQPINGEYPIVKLDHEAILCNGKIGKTAVLARDFRSLVLSTIHRAASQSAD